jgi:hypothetical protein
MPREPYCSHCGYVLTGLTESSKCPECGKPLVEVLERRGGFSGGRRYVSPISVFGLPLVAIAVGPDGEEKRGHAKGIIAVGDMATGWFAFGGMARGIVAFGGFAIGLIAFGGWAIGGLAFGGGTLGGIAVGGGAAGILAFGGGAAGYIAQGGGAAGYYAYAGGAAGKYLVSPQRVDDEAARVFARLEAIVGASPQAGLRWVLAVGGWTVAITLIVSAVLGTMVFLAYRAKVARSTRMQR